MASAYAANGDSSHLYSFLDRLSPSMFSRLYAAPASCLSIFRLLPVTARHVVLNMLWYDEVVRVRDVALWVRERKSEGADKGERRHLMATLSVLFHLHILTPRGALPSSALSDDTELDMSEGFRENFRLALTGGGKKGSFGAAAMEQDEEVTVSFLDNYAEVQWETIQHFMVGSDAGATKPSQKVLQLLAKSGLMMSPTASLRTMRITSKGFQFLLEDVNTQLWDLLLVYLEESQDLVATIAFLFMLSSLELGRAYLTDSLSEAQLEVLKDLADYGLIYRPNARSTLFYPTRLATTLTSSAPPLVSSRHTNEEKGFIVLETNYKLYAYTSNPLQISVLGLFAHLKTRFANFVTGHITRESIRRGLANGITANQIISYLASRAHPQMRVQAGSDDKILPTTVVDQIRLWEHERRRIKTTEGYLYDDFSSSHDYDLVVNYAREIGAVVLEVPRTRKVFVTAEGHLQVREFIKRRMAAQQQEAAEAGGEGGTVPAATRLATLRLSETVLAPTRLLGTAPGVMDAQVDQSAPKLQARPPGKRQRPAGTKYWSERRKRVAVPDTRGVPESVVGAARSAEVEVEEPLLQGVEREVREMRSRDLLTEAGLPRAVARWEDVVEACKGFTTIQQRRVVRPAMAALLPLTPSVLFADVAPILDTSFLERTGEEGGTTDIYIDYQLVRRALQSLKLRCGFKLGQPSRLSFPVMHVSDVSSLTGATPLRIDSIAEVERRWSQTGKATQAGVTSGKEPAKRDGGVKAAAGGEASRDGAVSSSTDPAQAGAAVTGTPPTTAPKKASAERIRRVVDASASLPTPATSVESTPEPPAKKARVVREPVVKKRPTAPAPAVRVPPAASSAEPVFLAGETKQAFQELVREAKELGLKHFELETLRLAYAHAKKHGGAAFVSLDVEWWERDQSLLLEFGWTTLELAKNSKTGTVEARRDDQHVVVKENQSKRNGRFAPDARDHFAFGRTTCLPQQTIYYTLAALLSTLSAHQHVFLIFHDPRADIRCLEQIGFNPERDFQPDLRELGSASEDAAQEDGGKVWIVDTQRLFSAWINRKTQVGLEKACLEIKVPVGSALHNAGNDSHFTLNLFERLMNRKRVVAPGSPLMVELDGRLKREAERKAKQALEKAQRAAEKKEQKKLSPMA